MNDKPLILARWNGEGFMPLDRFRERADELYVVGMIYQIDAKQPRSKPSHDHYFACVQKAWENLPEDIAHNFPHPESLRKYALIKCGFCDTASFVASSKAEAQRIATFIRPRSGYDILDLQKAPTITVFTAQTQSYRAMGKNEFQRSKDEVLGFLSAMIGVDVTTLLEEAQPDNRTLHQTLLDIIK
jgi:hypothetical protein